MELELRIRGDVTEIEKVIQLLKGTAHERVNITSGDLGHQAVEFTRGLSGNTLEVLKLIVIRSLEGAGIDESDLASELGIEAKNVWGAMGGLGRRWSSYPGESSETPFRKVGAGYQIPKELAVVLADALGISYD